MDLSNISKWTNQDWYNYHTSKLEEMPPEFLDKAVKFLTTYLSDEVKDKIKAAYREDTTHWIAGYHLGWGMGIRNALRNAGLPDDQLPDQNWDDYYGAVVEVVCGLRPMPGGNNE